MPSEHINEPREVGYSKEYRETIYTEWTKKESSSIFAGCTQADLFVFAMAVGYQRDKASEPKSKANNVPLSAFDEEQKWAVLSAAIAKKNDLRILTDEKPLYTEAENYAEEGIKIIQSHVERQGSNYPKYLEAELRELLSGGG